MESIVVYLRLDWFDRVLVVESSLISCIICAKISFANSLAC